MKQLQPHEYVVAPAAPKPSGHYSPGVVTPDGTIWVSAQLPLGGAVTSDSAVADQARQVLRNIVSIIEAAGGSAASMSKVTLYLTDIDDWDAVDNVFAEVFAAHRPARSVLQLAASRRGFRVSADAVGQRLQEFG